MHINTLAIIPFVLWLWLWWKEVLAPDLLKYWSLIRITFVFPFLFPFSISLYRNYSIFYLLAYISSFLFFLCFVCHLSRMICGTCLAIELLLNDKYLFINQYYKFLKVIYTLARTSCEMTSATVLPHTRVEPVAL